MSKVEFDPNRIKLVDISKVVPNTWNPKEENTPEFQKILQSVKQKGLRGVVVVREHPFQEGFYEIIDGQQRYTAAKALNYKKIYIQNEGQVDDKEAKELTIWYQQQVPFNRITEAYLVTEMADEFGIEELELPYSEKEYATFSELADFNFEMYKDGQDKETEQLDGTKSLNIKLSTEDYESVMRVLDGYVEVNGGDKAQALVQIVLGAE